MKNNIVHAVEAFVFVLVAAAACAACSKTQDPPPAVSTTTTTAARIVSRDDAIVRLGGARCDREVTCNNVGPDRKFESRYDCVRELGKHTRGELRLERCPGGVSEPKLDDCLLDVKYAQCESSLEHLEHFVACRRSHLCSAE